MSKLTVQTRMFIYFTITILGRQSCDDSNVTDFALGQVCNPY